MELFDLNSSLNNLSESSSFLVEFFIDIAIKPCILPISTKMLNFSLARLILMSLQPSSFSNPFCLCIPGHIPLYLCIYGLDHQLILLIYGRENMHQCSSLKHCVAKLFLLLQIVSQILTILIVLESLLDLAN